jgi:ABC-type glutathione transport system ATPase component
MKRVKADKLLKIISLKKSFITETPGIGARKTVAAVDDVSFEVADARITALVGESGSGKTTIARCVAGLEKPDSGEIIYNNEPLAFDTGEKRRRVQYVFQDTFSSLNPRMRAGEAIAEPIRFHFNRKGSELQTAMFSMLESVGLPGSIAEKYPHELSGGQRQRVVIARALALQPELLLADEPVSSLDVSIQAQVLSLLKELNEKHGISILFITHDLRIVKSLAHDVVVLKDGKIVEKGDVNVIFSSPRAEYTRLLLSSIPGVRRLV